MIKIAPSILSADFANLERDIKKVTSADYLHVDVMDGAFVPNITIGIPVVKSIRACTDMFLDIHLMVDKPGRYVEAFAKAGADMLDGLRINRVNYGKQCVEKPALAAGGAAFYDGISEAPEDVEQRVFYNAIVNGEPLTVEPRQAMVVTQILEAIYESGNTGKPVFFD